MCVSVCMCGACVFTHMCFFFQDGTPILTQPAKPTHKAELHVQLSLDFLLLLPPCSWCGMGRRQLSASSSALPFGRLLRAGEVYHLVEACLASPRLSPKTLRKVPGAAAHAWSQHSGLRGRRISEFKASLAYIMSSRNSQGYT